MRRRIVLIAAAVLLALAGTGALYQYVSGADARALTGQEAVTVLVAADAIPDGTDFAQAQDQGLVQTASFPRGAVPAGTFTDPAQAAGLVATRAIEPRELLTATTFGPAAAAGPVTGGLAVPAGKAALPVSLQHFANSADWAGYLRPGAEIAIFQTFTSAGATGPATPRGDGLALDAANTQVTRLLLDRVTVIAVAGEADAVEGAPGTAVVLAVDQRQSEKIILGLSSGVALYPVLLTADQVLVPTAGTTNTELFDTTGSTP